MNCLKKRRLIEAPFFVLRYSFLLILALFCIAAPVFGAESGAQLTGECIADRVDETVQLASVYDGDTIRLKDGRKVRLIGINAPEMGRFEKSSAGKNKENRPAEPLAEASRDFLAALLKKADSITLRYDSESHDRYKRLLAHAFVDGQINVQAQLLKQGLAAVIAVPPNLWAHDCYIALERKAVLQRQGIWGLPYYEPIETEQLKADVSGFRRISGTVERIGRTAKSVWLNLSGNVSLRIDLRDWPNFKNFDYDGLQGQRVIARGWLYQYKGRMQMGVRHPDSLEIHQENNKAALH